MILLLDSNDFMVTLKNNVLGNATEIAILEQQLNTLPTDVDFNSQQVVPWGVKKMNASRLWSSLRGEKVKIAILDSGIHKSHRELMKVVKHEFNAIDPNEPVVDTFGHGTAIAGIIAAEDNNMGIVGVSPHVELYSVKVLDDYGNGDVEHLVKGMEWCINNGVQIINMSFGITKDKPLLKEVVDKAVDEGIIIVAAVGNRYGGDVEYPAAYEKVISVTAVDENNHIASFAAKGKVDFAAPGVNILTTTIDGYDIHSGTSLAAAHVTGMIALILQNPEKYNIASQDRDIHSKVYEILSSWSIDLGETGKDEVFGRGLISID